MFGAVISREVEEYLIQKYEFVDTARLVVYASQLFVFVKRFVDKEGNVEVPKAFNIKDIFYVNEFLLTDNGEHLKCDAFIFLYFRQN